MKINWKKTNHTPIWSVICLMLLVSYSLGLNAQNVDIPDVNFKNALLNHSPVIDTNNDGEIQVTEATAFTGTINVNNKSISALKGIEDFVNITGLNCNNNNITALDLTNNKNLIDLACGNNQLTNLDISQNTSLVSFRCFSNQLTSLDISNNVVMEYFICYENQLTILDVSNNIFLKNLDCAINNLTTLDLSTNNLTNILCDYNQLTTLDVSNNTALTMLICTDNQLTSLDVSSNVSLTGLFCYNNQLNTLNVKNGNNYDLMTLYAYNNPELICIEVDNVTYSTENWTDIDSQTSFSENCEEFLSVNNDLTEAKISIHPNPVNDILHLSSNAPIEKVTISNMLGQQVNVSLSLDNKNLDLSNLANGNYFVKVTIEGVSKTFKIIKN